MPFLPPNQQHQSNEGTSTEGTVIQPMQQNIKAVKAQKEIKELT